ncbi:Immunity factor for TNT [Mycobacterium simulans]|uniref:Immunity factor for TNT n=1 Tax=Mycobacterium simulans TaxID=627089 RepID=A0A7Z7NCS7_9MYCO|nr:TNT antitoxin family protein [Mycobacterium simulans]SOK27508.1 Immunity factor for TNT [Mycobacterium simulans]SON61940.1 Immunity factor for TNT [Mycobacterium simulans]
MTDHVEISRELEKWGELAGYTLTPGFRSDTGRAVFWASLGEIRLLIGKNESGWIIITDSDRMGPEHFVLAAPSMTAIERYLFGKFGRAIRSKRGLRRVRVPISREEISTGFSIDTRQFEGVDRLALIASDGSTVAIGSGDPISGTADLVKLSVYLTATIDEIVASCNDPDGKPLFKRR